MLLSALSADAGPFIAPVTLHLATISGISAGLAQLGAEWNPEPFDLNAPPTTNGLYAWATDQGAIVYIGIGVREEGGGLRARVSYENSAATPAYIHAHALAITRLTDRGIPVKPYVGDVLPNRSFDPSWIKESGWSEEYIEYALRVSGNLRDDPYRQAEKFAVRLSVHLGDTGVPVNSTYKGAWDFAKASAVRPSDAAAYMVAERLVGSLRPDPAAAS